MTPKVMVKKKSQPGLDQLQLQQILYRQQQQRAVINGQLVTVGDGVNSFQVQSIEPDGVRLERNGKRFWLALVAGEPIKTKQ